MCVNPGHAGRQYVPYSGKKVRRLLEFGKEYNFDVVWDGSCTMERMEEFAPLGVKGFVLGTALLFGKEKSYAEILPNIRREMDKLTAEIERRDKNE